MKGKALLKRLRHSIEDNSPSILSGLAISGVVTTAYLTYRATQRSVLEIMEHPDAPETAKERFELTWQNYIPAAASGIVTIGCIVGSSHISTRRGAAAQAAFVLSERAYHEYRDKVITEIGANRDAKIRDEIAEDRVKQNPPPENVVFLHGDVICMELYTGRYFKSDPETLKRTENELNAQLLKHDRMSLGDFQEMLGLPPTSASHDLGWHADRLMELKFTTALTEDGRPCLAFDYNYVRPIYGGIFE